MRIALKNQCLHKNNSASCSVSEYPLQDSQMDMARAQITGRYPDMGRVVNHKCSELAYVLAGQGLVVIEGREIILQAEDVVIIEAGERYFWSGELQLLLNCRPIWTPEQHQLVG